MAKAKKVLQFSMYSGRFINKYDSLTEASIKTKTNLKNISDVCRNKLRTANGYVWRFEGDVM